MNNKTIAIIQARMSSTRLPRKVLVDLSGKPTLWHVFKRVSSANKVDKIIVATGLGGENDSIREFCRDNEFLYYSGSEDDVLDRYYQAAKTIESPEDHNFLRITADCPLIDPDIIDGIIDYHYENKADYTSNTIIPSFPDGLDCEIFTFNALETAWNNAKLKSEREHVTLYIYKHPELFKIQNYQNSQDLSHLRWTLDEEEDYVFIKSVYEELYLENKFFKMNDVLELLERKPELVEINSEYSRNEGLTKSIQND